MATKYAQHISTRSTPQTQPVFGKKQIQNNEGGFVFALDKWKRLERFLILGCDGGTYYVGERELTIENAKCIVECIEADAKRTVETIVNVSKTGRAPKNDPAIFALAICAANPLSSKIALGAVSDVCRIGTHIFQFADSVQHFRGWGRGLRNSIGNWYLNQEPLKLAQQVTKYQQRNGWSHRDLLRLSHPVVGNPDTAQVIKYALGKLDLVSPNLDTTAYLAAVEQAKTCTVSHLISLINQFGLVREHIPTTHLTDPKVWEALLQNMPMTAMIRNLGTMSEVGLLVPFSEATKLVQTKLYDIQQLKKARVHPFSILLALKTYSQGHGFRGNNTWDVVQQIVDSLDGAFYNAFQFVQPTGKNHFISVDVSGSMDLQINNTNITCCEAATAMAMTVARTEENYMLTRFNNNIESMAITAKTSLQDALKYTRSINFGGTDCSLPMIYAQHKGIKNIDVFVVLTDSETYAGRMHPFQALKQYRQFSGRDTKLIVVGMEANEFTIADPTDPGMLDVVGFDASCPTVMADFVR